jgi:hypothetical protein
MARRMKVNKKQQERREEIKQSLEYEQSTKSIIFNVAGVLIVFALFYFITTLVAGNKPILHEKEKTPAVIQYKEILAGETFNRLDSEYYVLFFDFNGEDASYYKTIASTSEKIVYIVDLSNSFNKSIVSEETNKSAQNASELKVKEATLIKIKNKRNVLYFEGSLLEIKANIK